MVKAEGFVDGVDPLFSGISQVIHDHSDNNTPYIVDQTLPSGW